MAALADNFHGWRPIPSYPFLEIEHGVVGADDFFRGALGHITSGTGKLLVTNADATEFFGVITQKKTTTAADELVMCLIRGVVWFTGVANLTTANVGKLMAATAASDNPADITAQAVGTPGAMGRLLAVETTAVAGYIDISDRAAVANA